MKTERMKQIRCISAPDPVAFEGAMNEALAGIADPDITFDRTRPFTAYIAYTVQRDLPECVQELLEMVCGHGYCGDCPFYEAPADRRRKWGKCKIKPTKTKTDSPACEIYYLREDGVSVAGAAAKALQIPFKSGR